MRKLKQYNNRLAIYLLLLFVAIGLMIMVKTCSYDSDILGDKSSGGDTLDIAIEYSPMSLYRYNDTLGGFNYDLIRDLTARHNIDVKFHPIVSLTEALDRLNAGKYDILIAEVPSTTDLKERFLFTDAIYLDKQVLVQRIDSVTRRPKIKSQLDLADDTVWVVANSPLETRIANLSEEIGDTIYVRADSLYSAEQLFILTAVGDIKQAVVNERIAKLMAKDYPQVDINTNISFTQFQSWLLNKNDSILCDSLNSWLSKYKLTPPYKSLETKYLK